MGIRLFKQARFAEAEQFLRKALERATDKYTTPKDAEPTYYLGVTLKAQGKFDEAFELLQKATWDLAWRAAGYFEAAEIASMCGEFQTAGVLVDRSLETNTLNLRALTLKAALARVQGHSREALQTLATARRVSDPLDARLMAEQWLATRSAADAVPLSRWMNRFPALAEETAAEMLRAGLWKDGAAVLAQAVSGASDKSKISPMVYYYLAYFASKSGQDAKAAEYYTLARQMPPDYVFPFQYEAIEVLRAAGDRDARAAYYLGNLLYDWQPEAATKAWERSAGLDASFAIVQRNLAVAYAHRGETAEAIARLEKAVSSDRKYAIHFTELDELYEAAGTAPEKRLALLEKNHAVVTGRDDSLAREISMQVFAGKYDEAIGLLTGRQFAVWEGTNLNVAEDWTNAHLLRGQQRLAAGRTDEALKDFQAATQVPENLPAGRGGAASAEAAYWTGAAQEALGNREAARQAWSGAVAPNAGPGGGRGGRGGTNPAQNYYRALAMRKLGQADQARTVLQALVSAGGPTAQSHYSAALGYLGLGDPDAAKRELRAALAANPAHLGARKMLDGLPR